MAINLARPKYAKKAIAERGWGPLTYVLLDDDRLIKSDRELNKEEQPDVSQLDINTINQTGEYFNYTLDLLMDERDKCQGRNRKHEEQK